MPASLTTIVKRGLHSLAALFGLRVFRLGSPPARCVMPRALRALAERGISVGTAIDVGASNGSWSLELMRHFPSSRYLLIEAQALHEPSLRDFCARHPNAEYVLAAAGAKAGEIFFEAREAFGGQASVSPPGKDAVRVPMVSVDDEVAARGLPGPYLLKLDTHGFEVPILEGAARTLERTEIIVVECYNFRIAPEALTFDEMCRHLGERGFRCIDLVDPLHRPYDDVFWQMDLVFARKDRPEFSYSRYR